MDKLSLMRVFTTVARTESFTVAAQELNISVQTVSKYIKTLEDDLAVQLFDRTTRKVNINHSGQAYFERCKELLEQFDELESAIREDHSAPKGKVRMSAPTAFGELHIIPALADFQNKFPGIEIELDLTNRRVSLVDEGFDLVIRIAKLSDSSFVAKKLTPMRVCVCTSPTYIEKFGEPASPEDLIHHNCLIDTNSKFGRHWPFLINGKEVRIDVRGNFSANAPASMAKMVEAGIGIAMCPYYVLSKHIINGSIVTLFDNMEAIHYGVYAIYPHRKHLSNRVRTLVDFLAQRFRLMQ